jgi:hypothetical protein
VTLPRQPLRRPLRVTALIGLLPVLAAAQIASDCSSLQYQAGSACDPRVRESAFLARDNRLLSALITLGQVADAAHPEGSLPDSWLWPHGDYSLFFGMPAPAEQAYQRLTATSAPGSTVAAYLKLAQFDYERDRLGEAQTVLTRVRDVLPPQSYQDWESLQARVLMAQGRFAEAAGELPADPTAAPLQRYNRGVALLRAGNVDQGRAVLAEVGTLKTEDPEQLALRDKANLVLGSNLLQTGAGQAAIPVFERIRTDGPFSNRALVGMGWAQIAAAAPVSDDESATAVPNDAIKRALVYWTAVASRDPLDPSAQDALLAIGYSLAQLGEQGPAAAYYRRAIAAFEATAQHLDDAVNDVRSGHMAAALANAGNDNQAEAGWTWHLENLPATPGAFYLRNLLAANAFQEALKNYRDTRLLAQRLQQWQAQLKDLQAIPPPDAAGTAAAQGIPALLQRIGDLQPRIAKAEQATQERLEALAVSALQEQQKQNQDRLAQARLGLAQLYDTAAPAGAGS